MLINISDRDEICVLCCQILVANFYSSTNILSYYMKTNVNVLSSLQIYPRTLSYMYGSNFLCKAWRRFHLAITLFFFLAFVYSSITNSSYISFSSKFWFEGRHPLIVFYYQPSFFYYLFRLWKNERCTYRYSEGPDCSSRKNRFIQTARKRSYLSWKIRPSIYKRGQRNSKYEITCGRQYYPDLVVYNYFFINIALRLGKEELFLNLKHLHPVSWLPYFYKKSSHSEGVYTCRGCRSFLHMKDPPPPPPPLLVQKWMDSCLFSPCPGKRRAMLNSSSGNRSSTSIRLKWTS